MAYTGKSLIDRAFELLDDDEVMFSRTQVLTEIQSKLRDILNRYPLSEFNYPYKNDDDSATGTGGVEIGSDIATDGDFLKDVAVVLGGIDAKYTDPDIFKRYGNSLYMRKPTILDPIYTVQNGYLYFSPDVSYELELTYVPLITLTDSTDSISCDDELLEFAMYGAVGYLANIDDYSLTTAGKYSELYHSKITPATPKR